MTEITLYHYLFLGLSIFVIGLAGSVFSKHIIKVLISIEIMLTGVNINFVTFGTYCDIKGEGYIMTLFYTAIGAIECAIALYIFYLMYKTKKSENMQDYGDL